MGQSAPADSICWQQRDSGQLQHGTLRTFWSTATATETTCRCTSLTRILQRRLLILPMITRFAHPPTHAAVAC